MKVSHFTIFSSLVALLFALVMTFVPLQFLQWLGFDIGGFTIFIARDYATAMLAFALGLWMVRKDTSSLAITILLLMWGLFNAAEVLVNLAAIIGGTLHPTTKAAAIPFSLHIVFAMGSAYFLFKLKAQKKAEQ